MKIYVFACVYTIFSHFIQTETQFIHFVSVCISERGEGGERDKKEWRARSGRGNKNICIYTISSYFIQIETYFIHLCLHKSERKRAREESDAREFEGERWLANSLLHSTIKSKGSYSN